MGKLREFCLRLVPVLFIITLVGFLEACGKTDFEEAEEKTLTRGSSGIVLLGYKCETGWIVNFSDTTLRIHKKYVLHGEITPVEEKLIKQTKQYVNYVPWVRIIGPKTVIRNPEQRVSPHVYIYYVYCDASSKLLEILKPEPLYP